MSETNAPAVETPSAEAPVTEAPVVPANATPEDPEGDGLTKGQATADVHGDVLGI